MENFFLDLGLAFWQLLRPLLAALAPLLIGLLLAYLLHPPVAFLAPKIGSGWAIAITYLGVFAALSLLAGGFVVLILGSLPSGSWQETMAVVTDYFKSSYYAAAEFLQSRLPAALFSPDTADTVASRVADWLQSRFSLSTLTAWLQSLSGSAVSLFLGIVASIYLLRDEAFFLRLWDRFLSLVTRQRTHGVINETMAEINQVVMMFLKGALIDSLIVAFLSSIVLSVLRLDFAVVIGILAGILNIIPYFGPFLGMIPAFIVGLFTGDPAKAILAVGSLFIVQQIDCNLIYPRIVGASTGLHPLFVLLSVSVLGYFFGIVGMLIAVPVAGILQIFIKRWAYR